MHEMARWRLTSVSTSCGLPWKLSNTNSENPDQTHVSPRSILVEWIRMARVIVLSLPAWSRIHLMRKTVRICDELCIDDICKSQRKSEFDGFTFTCLGSIQLIAMMLS